MTKDIWSKCAGSKQINLLSEAAWRLQIQDNLVTRKLVDSLVEQHILDDLLEENTSDQSHYLLHSPFRNPPLQQGSRFGDRLQSSLWYGSLTLNTAMIESAYYRFHFLRASKSMFENIKTLHTGFSVQVKTERGVNLTKLPFQMFEKIISSPVSYKASQQLGSDMRQSGVEAFCYRSARDIEKQTNIALFTPNAFLHKTPNNNSFQSWQCLANTKIVEFRRLSSMQDEYKVFSIELFLVDGGLPLPAN